jgi:hypothetical protein
MPRSKAPRAVRSGSGRPRPAGCVRAPHRGSRRQCGDTRDLLRPWPPRRNATASVWKGLPRRCAPPFGARCGNRLQGIEVGRSCSRRPVRGTGVRPILHAGLPVPGPLVKGWGGRGGSGGWHAGRGDRAAHPVRSRPPHPQDTGHALEPRPRCGRGCGRADLKRDRPPAMRRSGGTLPPTVPPETGAARRQRPRAWDVGRTDVIPRPSPPPITMPCDPPPLLRPDPHMRHRRERNEEPSRRRPERDHACRAAGLPRDE